MEVILLERMGRLGQIGDVVTVKDGYARNFLLPQGKALRATDANRKRFESERAQLEARDLERKGEAESVADKLNGQSFIVIRQAGDNGQLYGSVSTRDIATAVIKAEEEAFAMLCQIMPEAQARYDLARVLEHMNMGEASRVQLQLALKADPSHAASREFLTELDGVLSGNEPNPLRPAGAQQPAPVP